MTVLTDEPPAEVSGDRPGAVDPASMPLARVEAELCTLAGQIAAATARFLALLADFDAREGWAGTGIVSCAQWLSWRCGLDLRTAQEHVRVARALRGLPQTREVFEAGRVSYSKVRSISRVATADTEHDLVRAALDSPASHLDRLVRGLRKARRNLDDEAAAKGNGSAAGAPGEKPHAGVQWRWEDDGSLRVWGRLRAEDGARLLAGLTRLEQVRQGTDDAEDTEDTDDTEAPDCAPAPQPAAVCGQRRSAERRSPQPGMACTPPADLAAALAAAGELLCAQVRAPVFAPAADVLVHVDLDTVVQAALADADDQQPADDGAAPAPAGTNSSAAAPGSMPPLDPAAGGRGARLDDGPALTTPALQVLACDGRLQLAMHAADGRVLDLGRRRRRPTRAQLGVLWRRDRGCAYPGCGHTRFLHAHHVVPWAAGGRTDLDNLILLCGHHHRALHDGAFTIIALGRQRFRFHAPSGAPRPPAPRLHGKLSDLRQTYRTITATTIEPDWDGTPLDLPHATDVLLARSAAASVRRAETAAVS